MIWQVLSVAMLPILGVLLGWAVLGAGPAWLQAVAAVTAGAGLWAHGSVHGWDACERFHGERGHRSDPRG